MNYGYASLDHQTEKLILRYEDEPNRYFIQLYHHVASTVNLKGLNVIEVGSGRGGGSYYIKRYLEPETMIGVDISEDAVAFCNNRYSVEGLSFVTGDAESLPFENNKFDSVISIECSSIFGSIDAFLMEVKRILRPGGYFLFADIRRKCKINTLYEQLHNSGMTLLKETNITPNIFEALKLDNNRRTAFIKESVPKIFQKPFQEFAAVKGTIVYKNLQIGKLIYLSFTLQKK
ncbi:MAG: class I SAM-dependent methyltransferase [Candidatus Aminicenantales bacterium]